MRSFGRVHRRDIRDRKYKLKDTLKKAVRYRTRRWNPGLLLDQGDSNACVGYAWAAWFSASPIRQTPIAPKGIYELAKYLDDFDGEDYEGSTVRAGAKVLAITGHITEYRWCWDIDTAIEYLLTNGPLIIGSNWHEDMMEPDKAGFISPTGPVLGGHAYFLYYVNTVDKYVTLRNSWGPWGKRGDARLSFSSLQKLIRNEGECCAATESTVTYRQS